MAERITLDELGTQLANVSRGRLLRELHGIALDYAAKGETRAKARASTLLTVRSGRLAGSIAGRVVKRPGYIGIRLTAGGGGSDVKYAATHEYGATGANAITPKKSKFLTIPVHPSLKTAVGVGRVPRARDIPGFTFAQSLGGQPVLLHQVTGEVWYLLRKRVEIPARPYMRPSLEDIDRLMMPEVGRVLRGIL